MQNAPDKTPEKEFLSGWKFYLPLTVLLLAGIFFRVWGALMFSSSYGMDHAVPCLMTKHIASGEDLPVFYYGQPYMGSLEPLAGVPFYLLPIDHNLACNLGTALFGILLLPLVYFWGRKIGGRATGLAALAFIAIGPPVYMQFMNWSYGGYAALTILGSAMMLAALRVLELEQDSPDGAPAVMFLLTGLLAGIGWWTSFLLIPFMLTIAILFLAIIRLNVFRPKVLLTIPSFFIGSAPFWIWNLRHNWDSFRFVMKDTSETNLPQTLLRTTQMLLSAITNRSPSAVLYTTAAILLAGMLYCAARTILRKKSRAAALYMGAIPLVFIICLFFFVSKPTRIGPPRYCLALIPLFAVWLGCFTADFARRLGKAAPLAWLPLIGLISIQLPMLPVCRAWYNERTEYFALLDRLGDFLRQHDTQIMYAYYNGGKTGYGLNFYFNEELLFIDPVLPHYLPNQQRIELTPTPAVFKNAYYIDRLLNSSGGSANVAEMEGIKLYRNFQPPPFVFQLISEPNRISDTLSGTACGSVLSDCNLDTAWFAKRRANAELQLEWSTPQTLGAIRLIARDNHYPEYVTLSWLNSSNRWITLKDFSYSPWFWTPERPFCDGDFYRQIIRLPNITTRAVRLIFNHGKTDEDVCLAEIRCYEPVKHPATKDTDAFPQLCKLLQEKQIEALYCDRGLADRLYREGPPDLALPLDSTIFPDDPRRLPADPTQLKNRTALLTLRMNAACCRQVLQKLNVRFEQQEVGTWVLFMPEPLNHKHLRPLPLSWLGFAPIISDNNFHWRRQLCRDAANHISDSEYSSADILLQPLVKNYPDHLPALRLLKQIAEQTGNAIRRNELETKLAQLTPQHSLKARFSNGYKLEGVTLKKAGNPPLIEYTCFWQTPDVPRRPVAVFVHLLDGSGKVIAQDDHIITTAGTGCVSRAESRFTETRRISIPPPTVPENCRLEIGLYQASPPFKRFKIKSAAVPLTGHRKALLLSGSDRENRK